MLYYAVQRLSLTKNFHRDPDSIRKIYLSCFITSVPYYNKAERVTVRFSFSCTSLLYYILCLCKSFKELFPFRGANPSGTLLRSVPPCLRLQRYIGSGRFTSIGTTFLWIKRNFSFLSLYIYCAREAFLGYPRHFCCFWGDLGWRKEKTVFVPFGAVLLPLTMKYNFCRR